MVMIASAFSTYAAKGIREDLSDTIWNISPTETPLCSNAGKRNVTNTFFEWQTDNLGTALTTNAQLEGDVIAASAITATVRLGNYVQIMDKRFAITGTEEAVKKAGRKSEIAYQTAKKGKELKRDMEAAFTSIQVAVAGGATTARQSACFDSWLKTNTDNGAGGSNYAYTTTPITARTAGTARAFTEVILKTVIRKQWNAGGEPKLLMVGPYNKTIASTFVGIADNRYNVKGDSPTTIIGAADIYVSDFGNVNIVPNRFQPEFSAYIVDPEHVNIGVLRPFHTEELAKTGDGRPFAVRIEAGIEVTNESAHGVAHDLTTS
jgi:hypothetical protein